MSKRFLPEISGQVDKYSRDARIKIVSLRLTFKQRDDDQHHGHRRRHLEAEDGDLEEAGTSLQIPPLTISETMLDLSNGVSTAVAQRACPPRPSSLEAARVEAQFVA